MRRIGRYRPIFAIPLQARSSPVGSTGLENRTERFTLPRLDGVHLAVIRYGDAALPPVVLLHGAGANAHWWDHLAPGLAERFHPVALDFRGHGDSDFPKELVPGAFRDDLEALLEWLGAPRAPLVGHSLGAHVALGHAAAGGDPAALVLIDPARGLSATRRRATRLALSLRPTYASRDEAVRRFQFLPGPVDAAPVLRTAVAEHSVRPEPDGRFGFKFDARWFGVPERDRPSLGGVRAPTLILRGAESPLLTDAGAHELVRGIVGAKLVEIAGAGHHVQMERPEACLAAIAPFLAEHRP
jgi:pimeloyl-ACP methyl ester carboxylesterase